MKFMKLGSKPDLFKCEGSTTRYVECELPPDVIVNIGEARFHLHKFPLISKSLRLRNLIRKESEEEEGADELYLYDIPGGPKAFEICAKFCYGMTVTLNAHNVIAARCAAEYLEMGEDAERGNMIFKIEVFLSSSIFQSWKDSIICLQITKPLLPWTEDLKIVGRCVDSIASKISLDHRVVHWSYTNHKRTAVPGEIVDHGTRSQRRIEYLVPVDWWVEDISDLDVDHYEMVMVAVKDREKISAEVIIEGLKAYAERWLPKSIDDLVSEEYITRSRSLVGTLIWLMPSGVTSSSSCSFLLKLLRVVVLIGEDQAKEELLTLISQQLEKASVKDLLIPATPPCCSVYDLHLVQTLITRGVSSKDSDHGSLFPIWKLIDGCLVEIASDPNLPLSSFVDFARTVPEVARAAHDGLYAAIDFYLKEHPALTKSEKKKLCGLIDVRKLSAGTCAHAAQNERLPLRVVVQVLFFEQLRAAAAAAGGRPAAPSFLHGRALSGEKLEEAWQSPSPAPPHAAASDHRASEEKGTSRGGENRCDSPAPPSRSRRIFDRWWVGKLQGEKSKSSESCGSSLSPSSASVIPGRVRTPGPPSRLGRHSIS
ncbi:unnamed protein product [Spirodela intermedia]|uniref:Uncharacterized protein n=1 Tax=Spirodela intermedia TaxID=51605 RepID=A0A7I8LDJ7_SPIIN|nr:unnamed protein product [Spirodela intermedia]